MGIQVEFNPDLALRNFEHFKNGEREIEECIPERLERGKVYLFLKKGQRNYYFLESIPLVETEGMGKLSRPIAEIKIIEAIHFLKGKEVWTKGRYKVERVFDSKDKEIHFEGFNKTGK